MHFMLCAVLKAKLLVDSLKTDRIQTILIIIWSLRVLTAHVFILRQGTVYVCMQSIEKRSTTATTTASEWSQLNFLFQRPLHSSPSFPITSKDIVF